MQHRNESRTGRHCLEGQTTDSGLLELPEASPPRFSGPSQFLAQTAACLTQAGSGVNLLVMSVEKLSHIVNFKPSGSMTISVHKNSLS